MNTREGITRVLVALFMILISSTMILYGISASHNGMQDDGPSVPANTVIAPDVSHSDTAGEPTADTLPGEQTLPSATNPSEQTLPSVTNPSEQTLPSVTNPSEQTLPSVTNPSEPPAPQPEADEYFFGRVECSGRLTVATETANVRTDANGSAQLIAVIYQGESYEVISQKCSPTEILWYEIRIGDTTGYVSGSYVYYDGPVIGGKVYLTFDDGPSDNTLRILDTLDSYGAKATFFVVYRSGKDDIYREIVNRGHTIALHSYSHRYETIYSGTGDFFSDLKKLDDHVYALTGVHSRIIRFPGGTSNTISKLYCPGIMTDLAREVHNRGYLFYDWNVDSGDAEQVVAPADDIRRNVINGIGNRRYAIVLMHDAAAKTTTADALPDIIKHLQAKGYELLPITENTPEMHQSIFN